MVVANLSPAVAEELGVPSSLSGVVALEIKGGPAKRFFRKGDILLEVNGVSIASVDDLQRAVAVRRKLLGIRRSTAAGANCR